MSRLVIVASMGGRLASDNLSAYCSSKAAIISVATVLRREMAKFGVRVSTIEPAFFKTGVYYAVIPSFEHNWANTPDPIRQVYGNQYFADQLAALKRRRRLSFGSKNLGTVVDAMVDAVRSRSPNKTYSPVNVWPFKVVPLVLPYIPQWVLDLGFRELDSTKPAFVSQKAK
ncbi:unnamed protein product [Medioppia subpectinata]|uniref:Uncharacterized protein n=1 Tax=Medioppia subpectinata TaxID=1979941 RepID=A0A7R9L6N1_9ACAR|nr:unnamed protein product [Medioppia subpectinata]CAG2116492.1 unnamed protein product [Medioppia subpectinata]